MFHSIFIKEYDKCFPLKVVKVNYRTKKPWLSPALKIFFRKKLYKTFIENPTFTNDIAYKNYKRLLNTVVRRTERDHYADLIIQHRHSMAKTLSVI